MAVFQSAFHHHKPRSNAKLNLVALMDIFTILVFFLLLNSGEADRLESAKFVTLPDSQAGSPPHDDLVIMIGEESIWLGQEMLVSIDEVADSSESSIPALTEALAEHRERKGELNSYEQENGMAVTIMGDRAVSYGLLKSVMATCRQADYRDLALAVNQVATPASSSAGAEPSPELADRLSSRGLSAKTQQGER